MTSTTWTILIVAMVVMWVVQFGMAWLQMKNFYGRLRQLRQNGLTAVGKSGGQYKGRTYGVLVVDDSNRVTHAEKLAGFTVFAKLRPVPQLVGATLVEILDDSAETNRFNLNNKLLNAFQHAAEELQLAPRQNKTASTQKEDDSPSRPLPENGEDIRPSWMVA